MIFKLLYGIDYYKTKMLRDRTDGGYTLLLYVEEFGLKVHLQKIKVK